MNPLREEGARRRADPMSIFQIVAAVALRSIVGAQFDLRLTALEPRSAAYMTSDR